MKGARWLLCLSLAVGSLVSLGASSSQAQDGAPPPVNLLSLGYWRVGSGPLGVAVQDNTLRLINDGASIGGDSASSGALCANIYVFNSNQNMLACCSCAVSANGLLARNVLGDLIPTQAVKPGVSGVIKVVSSLLSTDGKCAANATYEPAPEFVGWITHYPGTGIPSVLTEVGMRPGSLSKGELVKLIEECGGGLSSAPATVHACACPPVAQ